VIFESGSQLWRFGLGVFFNCWSLSSICLPPRLHHLGHRALSHTNLRDVFVADGDSRFTVSGHFILKRVRTSIAMYIGNMEEVTIPKNIKKLGSFCFAKSEILAAVIFESDSSLLSIGHHAFWCCASLVSICIPSSVESLDDLCFSVCISLASVTFEMGSLLRRLGGRAFWYCQSLTSISVPCSVKRIDEFCFGECTSLSIITFEAHSKLSRVGRGLFRCWWPWRSRAYIRAPRSLRKVLGRYREYLQII
jgi:hypothetical protein